MINIVEKLYISEKQAAERYCYSRAWFQRARWAGNGPKFTKTRGKVLYPLKETDEWFAGHGLRSSTSDAFAVGNKKIGGGICAK